jgi:hypothetical protein
VTRRGKMAAHTIYLFLCCLVLSAGKRCACHHKVSTQLTELAYQPQSGMFCQLHQYILCG